jgi:ABC-type lipoprotein export system ATPase subunit
VKRTDLPQRYVLELSGLEQVFRTNAGAGGFTVCVDGPLRIPQGGFVTIRGPNGCGKTTLMTVLALLRRPSNIEAIETFRLSIAGAPHSINTRESAADTSTYCHYDLKRVWSTASGGSRINDIRRQYFGFCPQQLELLSALNVEETVGLSLRFNGWPRRLAEERVNKLLQDFDLVEKRRNRIDNVSGGQQQKVTIARAIAHSPAVVFLDEPTAFLHVKTARQALIAMQRLQLESGGRTTIVMITHDNDLAEEFSTTIVNMEGDGTRGWVRSVDERNE